MKKLIYALGTAAMMLIYMGCEKSMMSPAQMAGRGTQTVESSSGGEDDYMLGGKVTVKLVNSAGRFFEDGLPPSNPTAKEIPGNHPRFDAIFVDIVGVQIHSANGWTELKTAAAIYDLVAMNSKTGLEIVSEFPVNAGQIDQIRLVLGSGNAVGVAGTNYALQPEKIDPSLTTISLANASIYSKKTTEIVIALDQYTSVYKEAGFDYTGDVNFFFKPALSVKNISQI